jgi:hypothetical protein
MILSSLLQNIPLLSKDDSQVKNNIRIAEIYTWLVNKHSSLVSVGCGYNFPRSISYLIYLELFIRKYGIKNMDISKIFQTLSKEYLQKYIENNDEFKDIFVKEIADIGDKIKEVDRVPYGIKMATSDLFTETEVDTVCNIFKKLI